MVVDRAKPWQAVSRRSLPAAWRCARAAPAALILALAVAACDSSPVRGEPPAGPYEPRESIDIAVAATGDLNGWLVRDSVYPGERRGLAHLAPVIARLRAEHPGLILLDGGDALAGSPEAARLASQPAPSTPAALRGMNALRDVGMLRAMNALRDVGMLRAMNALRYDAAVPGNRDLGLGAGALGAALAASAFPWLAANVTRDTGGARQTQMPADPPFPPYVILERGPPEAPVRIAVLGLTTPGLPMWVSPAQRSGLVVSGVERAAEEWLPRLRARADLVIALVHSGLDGDYEREEAVGHALPLPNAAGRLAARRDDASPSFDLIVSASAHRLSPRPSEPQSSAAAEPDRAVPVLEPGSRGEGLAVARFRLERDGGAPGARWRVASVTLETHRAELRPDPVLLDLARDSLAADRAWLDAPTAVRFRAIPQRRQFFACAGALQHAAITTLTPQPPLHPAGEGEVQVPPSPFHGEGPGVGVLFSLLPMLWREHYPAREELGQPLRRVHLFRWMPYEDRPLPAHLTGRQIALLLEPYVRWRRGLVSPLGNVLHPGGLTPFWERLGGEAAALAIGSWSRPKRPPPSRAPLLDPHERYPVWLSAFAATGGGGLAPKALLHASQLGEEAGTTIRELVFRYLSDPASELPRVCQGWLAR